MFEVEKRAKFLTEADFVKCKESLEKNGKFRSRKEMLTFLFREPHYMRVRLVKDNEMATITYKTGTYGDLARKEVNLDLYRQQLRGFIEIMEAFGFKECASLRSERYSYDFNGFNVELNKIDKLGLLVEIETIVADESELNEINKKISETLALLEMKELDSQEYQNMMDEMYQGGLQPISVYTFNI